MYKLFVSSFDKTLIDDDLAIPISTVLTIDEIRRKNIKFIVATANCISYIKDYIRDVNFIDYIIALNGSYIYDVMKDKVIYEKKINKDIIRKIVKKYKNTDSKIYLCTDHSKCIIKKENADKHDVIVRDLEDFLKNNKVYKAEIHFKTKKNATKKLNEIKQMNLLINIDIENYNDSFVIEITSVDISKYVAIKKVCEIEKTTLKDTAVIGCNKTDLELIKKAGYSISVNNACQEVKKYAIDNTDSNNNRGVEKAIIKLFKLK